MKSLDEEVRALDARVCFRRAWDLGDLGHWIVASFLSPFATFVSMFKAARPD